MPQTTRYPPEELERLALQLRLAQLESRALIRLALRAMRLLLQRVTRPLTRWPF